MLAVCERLSNIVAEVVAVDDGPTDDGGGERAYDHTPDTPVV